MKKLILFLLILILISSYTLFAADPVLGSWTWSSDAVSGSAYVPVSVNSKDTKKCVVGFTTTIPEDFGVATTVTPIASSSGVSLTISDADGTASNSSDPLYLYYQIVSGENINIAIYGEKELSSTSENSTNQDKVKWAVKNGNTTYVDFGIEETKGNSDEEKVDIYQHRPQATTPTSESGVVIGNTFGKAGSIQLSINTESLWEKKADIYSANLIVVISTESSTPGGN